VGKGIADILFRNTVLKGGLAELNASVHIQIILCV
jgi:hypothetical protein